MEETQPLQFETGSQTSQTRLKALLRAPEKKSEAWQAECSRLVAIEHNKTLSAVNEPVEYLRSLALCRLAQIVGVNTAKKINIKAKGFEATPPPALSVLEDAPLATAACEVLSQLRSSWCGQYISSQLTYRQLDKKGAAILVQWAHKISKTINEFMSITLTDINNSGVEEDIKIALIKECNSKAKFSRTSSIQSCTSELSESLRIFEKIFTSKGSLKIEKAILDLQNSLIENGRQAHPFLVLDQEFLNAVANILKKLSKTSHVRFVAKTEDSLLPPTISIISSLITNGGDTAIQYCRAKLPTIKQAYATWDKQFEAFAKLQPELKSLEENNEEHIDTFEDSATSIYARLLPAWHDYMSNPEINEEIAFLGNDILAVAKINGFELLGQSGEDVLFNPIEHKLSQGANTSPETQVKILKPGVIYKRSTGTRRIILPAIVSST